MGEVWRPVVGWEDHYEVSNLGKVRSITRWLTHKNGRTRIYRGLILKYTEHPIGGYPIYHLARPKFTCTAHRLVTRAFIGPMPRGMEVRHLDSNPLNNCISNLVYGTRSENIRDEIARGTHHNAAKTLCPLGHSLCHPNLVAHLARKGYRNCLACRRARCVIEQAKIHNRFVPHFKPLADEKYERILRSSKSAREPS